MAAKRGPIYYVSYRTLVYLCVAVQLQIEEITRRLQTGELGIPAIGERFVSFCWLHEHDFIHLLATNTYRTVKKYNMMWV